MSARFKILVVVDGSEASAQALRYAIRIGSGTDADMTLIYVRPVEQGMRSGGLQDSVTRQNLRDWGVELPGTKALRQARQILLETGYMGKDWSAEVQHSEVHFDPIGDHTFLYRGPDGRQVVFRLLVSPSVARGVLDQCDVDQPDIVILAPSETSGLGGGRIDLQAAEIVAVEHTGSVLVARELEESHGHLICVWKNEQSIEAARRDAEIAARCDCPVYLYSVAATEEEYETAQEAVDAAEAAIADIGAPVFGKKVEIGDPVTKIIEEGRKYSVIVMSSRSVRGLRRYFTTGTSFRVLQRAHNSVMIAR
ncbi:MAG: universal stress protein [Pseudomonadota bacterium]